MELISAVPLLPMTALCTSAQHTGRGPGKQSSGRAQWRRSLRAGRQDDARRLQRTASGTAAARTWRATGCMLLIPSNKARSLTAVPSRALAASSPLYAAAWLDGRRSSTLQRRAAMELSRIAGRGGEDAVVVLAVSWWRRISRWPVGGADPRGGARWATAYLWGMPLPIAY